MEYPIPTARCFEVDISAFELTYPILKGTQVSVHLNTARCPGVIRKVAAILDTQTG